MDLSWFSFVFLPFCSSFVAGQHMLSSFSLWQSGIPNNADPFPGTLRKPHHYLMLLLIRVTTYSHLWCATVVIVVQDCFSMDLSSSMISAHGKNILHILMNIRLPSLPASILYINMLTVFTTFCFYLCTITDLMLWILKIFDLSKSKFFAGHLSPSFLVSWHMLWTALHFSL